MDANARAALIGLGDQPQLQEETVRLVLNSFEHTESPLIIPSHNFHRGHPWLVGRELWQDLMDMKHPQTPRDFLIQHAARIQYVEVDNTSILDDLDTPEDYQRAQGG